MEAPCRKGEPMNAIRVNSFGILIDNGKRPPFLYGDKRGPWLNLEREELEALAADRGLIAQGARIVAVEIRFEVSGQPATKTAH